MAGLYPSSLSDPVTASITSTPTGVGEVAFWDGALSLAGVTGFIFASATNSLTLNGGCVINESGGSAATDDFRVETDTLTNALFVDASANTVYIGGPTAALPGLAVSASEVVVNEASSSAIDFRVESNGFTHMLFVDAGTDRIGIGTNNPDVQVVMRFDGLSTFANDCFHNANGPIFVGRRALGSQASPTQVTSGSEITRFSAQGRTSTGAWSTQTFLRAVAQEDLTGAAQGVKWQLYAIPATSVTPAECVTFNGDITIFNDSGADMDFRIEGDNDANLFVCDAGNDRVGFGISNPDSRVVVRTDGVSDVFVDSFEAGAQNSSNLRMRRTLGTLAAPTQVTSSTDLGRYEFQGRSDTGAWVGSAVFRALSTENFTAAANGTRFQFWPVVTGSASTALALEIDGSYVQVNPNGGDLDFIVDGDTLANLFVCDASTDRVGVGVAAPLTAFHLNLGAGSNPGLGNTGLLIQNNAAAGDPAVLTLLSGATANTSINFATASSLTAGQIRFNNSSNLMTHNVGGSAICTLASTGQMGVSVGSLTPAGRLEVAQSGGNTDLILRQTNEGTLTGATVEFATGSAGSALSDSNQMGQIFSDITQASPSALQAEMGFSINVGDSLSEVLRLGITETTFNEAGADRDTRIEGDADTNLVFVDAGADTVGVGIGSPVAKMHVNQNSATGAIACIELDQDDTDQPFVDFDGSIGADTTSSISSHGTPGSITHWLQIDIEGVGKRWIAAYNDPSA